ncbi:unannotated protein [freshwater metagenome]|uniref:Unannotated protein n=1 Tax=freshwater metagenome TaxID=449393 RepID=A0A6J7QPY2_9ZZZZ
MNTDQQGGHPRRMGLPADASVAAARRWWDSEAEEYLLEHGDFLAGGLIWGPEGLTEAEVRILGPHLAGLRVLEVGCGAAQGSRWLRAQGALVVGLDVSGSMLAAARQADVAEESQPLNLVQASGDRLPFSDGHFDAVVSAHGAFAFMADLPAAFAEAARVLRRGGLLAFSVTHPTRWAFPDDPGPEGLIATMSYFDRRAYVELDDHGTPEYVEHHRTMGDTVEALVGAGFSVERLVEPEWPDDLNVSWGAWSPLRGELLPGTALWAARLR